MNIVWYGQSCFRITLQGQKKSKEKVSLVFDPFEENIGLKLPKLEADILLITHEHHDHANRSAISNRNCFTIDGPGEYEISDVFVQGTFSFHDKDKGAQRGVNTIYTIDAEGVRMCHLGDFGEEELSSEQLQEIGEVDILMVPVGGVYTINAKEATKVISQIEPKIVIPMHYKIPGLKIDLSDISSFLKAIGEKQAKEIEKLSVTEKTLPKEEMSIIPLIPQAKK